MISDGLGYRGEGERVSRMVSLISPRFLVML